MKFFNNRIDKKKRAVVLLNIIIFLFLFAPLMSFGQDQSPTGLIPCVDGENCNFGALMDLVNNVIEFILKYMAVPIAAIMFFYAGFKMVTAGGEAAHAREQAKGIFLDTVVGLVLVVGAVLIIKTVLSILGYKGAWIGF